MLVLIADDNQGGRQLVVDIILSMNLRVMEATDGQEAVELTRLHLPDLVILDVSMPGMSGFEACELIKADPLTAKIPVLMLTALSGIDSRVQGFKLGADDYIAKPFNPRELMERIKTRLRYKHETDELRRVQVNIRNTFERYVAPSVVEQLLRDPAQIKLGGTLQAITVLFADLEGFTGISERTEPEKLLNVLNTYHTMIVSAIRDHGGTVDKFIGDGVMALYNTPLPQANHARQAVETALYIRRNLSAFHEQFEPMFRMKVNFGIHTGTAVIGNVGAPEIMNFTAVGDTVNLAARLQNRSEHGQILISAATCEQIGSINTELIGTLQLKGRAEAVTTYAVTDADMSAG